MSTTFYLKYRPQNFQELDSADVREELEKIFKSDKFPHAFLFSGPRGIGKTSSARIVAKAVNCLNRKGFEPCNQCESCLSITQGTSMDVYEIDAASNRGIDDIKELREKIKLAPTSSKYKVYIIDEVHMLTTEAFNALLKTLEEPPKHAIFILCTTDPEKLPKTIISRCTRINFKRASNREIVERLKRICQEEKLDYEEEALKEIARMADGGFRDAVKNLEQVSLGGKVSLAEVQKVAGLSRNFAVDDFLGLLKEKKTKEALNWINEAADQGINLRTLVEEILEKLRVIMLENFGLKAEEKEGTISFNAQELKILIELFSRAFFELRSAVIPQLPLEIAIIEWCENQFNIQNSKLKIEEEEEKEKGSGEKNGASTPPVKGNAGEKDSPVSAAPTLFTIEYVLAKWPEILERVKPMNHSVQAFLKASRPLACEGDRLILEVFYKFHKDQLESEKCRRIFEKAASEVLGSPVKLKCSLSENSRQGPKPLPKIEEYIPETPLSKKKSSVSATRMDSQKNPDDDIIRLAEDIFNKGSIN